MKAIYLVRNGEAREAFEQCAKQAEKWTLAQPEVHGLFAGIGVSGPAGPGQVTNAVMVAILTSAH